MCVLLRMKSEKEDDDDDDDDDNDDDDDDGDDGDDGDVMFLKLTYFPLTYPTTCLKI